MYSRVSGQARILYLWSFLIAFWPKARRRSVFRVFPCIPVYSRYSRVLPVFPCIPGIPCIPCITGYTRYSVYSRYSGYSRYSRIPVYSRYNGVYPRIPVYSRVFRVFRVRARPASPLSPEAHSGTPGRVRVGALWQVHPPHPHPLGGGGGVPCHIAPPRTRPGVREWPSGLNRPRGVRVGRGSGPPCGPRLLYLRSIWPGVQMPPWGIWGNRWIGSRAGPPWGPADVSDLECLNPRCGRAGSGDVGAGSGVPYAGSVSYVDGSG